MPITPQQVEHAAREARAAFDRGNVARADLICQSVLAQQVRPPELVLLKAQVAIAIGELEVAEQSLAEVAITLAHDPHLRSALISLQQSKELRLLQTERAVGAQKFHLIKAWGFGLTADIDHTLGHLLLAEMTGRVPIVDWGANSLFRDASVENAWTEFFEPVSGQTISKLRESGLTFFPSKWSTANLQSGEVNKLTGPGTRTAGIHYLNQSADVTVGDFFTSVIELLPWVRDPHPLASNGPVKAPVVESAYQYLVGRYLKLKPDIAASVDSFANLHFQNRPVMAVHVRGTDKAGETANLAQGHQLIFDAVTKELAADPRLSIFLLTDEDRIRKLYVSAFSGRVITTDCRRSETRQGIHYQQGFSGQQLGVEVLRDAYLAARCDRFLALGCTNVSNFILHLKAWPMGTARLLGPVSHYQRNFLIHG